MSRAIDPSHFTWLKIIDFDNKLEVRRIWIETSITAQQKLYHISSLGACHHCGRLVPTELYLIFDCLRLYIGVIERVWYNCIWCLCHPYKIINYKELIQQIDRWNQAQNHAIVQPRANIELEEQERVHKQKSLHKRKKNATFKREDSARRNTGLNTCAAKRMLSYSTSCIIRNILTVYASLSQRESEE